MKFPKTLDAKGKVIDSNGNEIIDLTESSLKNTNFSYVDLIITRDEHCMRPDIIANDSFNNIEKIEDLLKANDISNPFAINESEPILIPNIISANEQFKTMGIIADVRKKIRQQYIDTSKAPDTGEFDTALDEFKSREKTSLPPNIAREGDKEMLIKDGIIVFGPDVTRNKKEILSSKDKEDLLNKLKNI